MSSNKAVLAAVAAALASFIATVQGRPELETLRAIDWVIVVLSAVVAGITVYAVPNQPTPRRRNDVGQSVLYVVLVVVGVLLAILLLARIL